MHVGKTTDDLSPPAPCMAASTIIKARQQGGSFPLISSVSSLCPAPNVVLPSAGAPPDSTPVLSGERWQRLSAIRVPTRRKTRRKDRTTASVQQSPAKYQLSRVSKGLVVHCALIDLFRAPEWNTKKKIKEKLCFSFRLMGEIWDFFF